MAKDALALIFGKPRKGKGMMDDEPEEREDRDTDIDELRPVARKILDACKNDDEDLMCEALEDLKALDEGWDREMDEEE